MSAFSVFPGFQQGRRRDPWTPQPPTSPWDGMRQGGGYMGDATFPQQPVQQKPRYNGAGWEGTNTRIPSWMLGMTSPVTTGRESIHKNMVESAAKARMRRQGFGGSGPFGQGGFF